MFVEAPVLLCCSRSEAGHKRDLGVERDSIICGLLYDPSRYDPLICVFELKIATHVAVVARLVNHVAAICIYVLARYSSEMPAKLRTRILYAGST